MMEWLLENYSFYDFRSTCQNFTVFVVFKCVEEDTENRVKIKYRWFLNSMNIYYLRP